MKKRKTIGLALGGGGARGLAHIGVLKVLKKEGIPIDMIAGVSMGAFVGAFYVCGFSPEEIEEEAISFNKKKAIVKMMDLGRFGTSILKGRKIRKYLENKFKDATFKESSIPFQVIATDLESGDEIIIKKGSLSEAVRASITVPGIFPPIKINGRYLIDGGVVNPTPTDTLKDMGADIIIGVDLVMQREVKLDDPGLITTLMQSYEIIRTQAVKYRIEKATKNTIMIKPKLRGAIDSFKFYDINKFIRSGEEAAKEMLPEILKKIGS